MPEQTDEKNLPLADLHRSLGARFGHFAGWQMPLWYEGAMAEHKAVRQAAGVFDISHMGRFLVRGQGVAASLSNAFSRDLAAVSAGTSIYALACNESGGIVDDLMIYRLAEDRFIVICNAANQTKIASILDDHVSSAAVQDLQPGSVLIAAQGPHAVDKVCSQLGEELRGVSRRGCIEIEAAGRSYFCGRTGYTGEDGFEIMTAEEGGRDLLDGLIENGCAPCGLAARDSLRLEAALPLHGPDIDESTTPWEAGLGWALDLNHEFVGRDALQRLKGAANRHLSCMVSDGQGVLRGHMPVFHDGAQVASTTSGGYSLMLGRSIAMGYLPDTIRAPGTLLEVDVRGRRVPCHVVKRPFYRSRDLP